MVWLRPVRFGSAEEEAKLVGAGTVDPYDTRASAMEYFRNQRPFKGGQLWVGKGLIAPKTSIIDGSFPTLMLLALGTFFILK